MAGFILGFVALAYDVSFFFLHVVGVGSLTRLSRFFMLKFVPESAENLHRTLLDVVIRSVVSRLSVLEQHGLRTLNPGNQTTTMALYSGGYWQYAE